VVNRQLWEFVCRSAGRTMGRGRGSKVDLVSTTSSVGSLSSSDVSSDTLSMIHRRSTPKIAAIIILAFFVIAGLVGAVIYFMHDNKLLNTSFGTKRQNLVLVVVVPAVPRQPQPLQALRSRRRRMAGGAWNILKFLARTWSFPTMITTATAGSSVTGRL